MREFIPSDYIDKEGNVYETVGENIREGKNGAVTSEVTEENKEGYAPLAIKGVVNYVDSKLPYLKNAKTGIVIISIDKNKSASIIENSNNLNIYTETGTDTLRILCKTKNKNIIDLKVLKCTTDSASNFDVEVKTIFSIGKNSLFKQIITTNIKTITLLLSVEV